MERKHKSFKTEFYSLPDPMICYPAPGPKSDPDEEVIHFWKTTGELRLKRYNNIRNVSCDRLPIRYPNKISFKGFLENRDRYKLEVYNGIFEEDVKKAGVHLIFRVIINGKLLFDLAYYKETPTREERSDSGLKLRRTYSRLGSSSDDSPDALESSSSVYSM